MPVARQPDHRLQVRRRRQLDRRPREPAQEPRRLRRVQLGRARRLRSMPAARRDRLARRDHVLRDRRSLRRRRPGNNAPVSGVEQPGPVPGRRLRRAASRRSTRATSTTSASTRSGSRRRSTTPTTRTPASDGHSYSGYHGYWPKDLERAPSRSFGSEAELKAMVDAAHAHGIQVLIDYVMNHVHDAAPDLRAASRLVLAERQRLAAATASAAAAAAGTPIACAAGSIRSCPTSTSRTPTRASARSTTRSTWAKRIGIDGFRLDAVKHIETSWLTDRARAAQRRGRAGISSFYMVGETFDGDRGIIKSYVNPGTMLDGQFDFPLRGQMLSTAAAPRRRDERPRRLPRQQRRLLRHRLGDVDVPRQPRRAARDRARARHADVRRVGRRQETAWTGQPPLPTTANAVRAARGRVHAAVHDAGHPDDLLRRRDRHAGRRRSGQPPVHAVGRNYSQNQTWLRDQLAALAKIRATASGHAPRHAQTIGVASDVFVYKMTTAGDAVFVALNRGDSAQLAVEPRVGHVQGSDQRCERHGSADDSRAHRPRARRPVSESRTRRGAGLAPFQGHGGWIRSVVGCMRQMASCSRPGRVRSSAMRCRERPRSPTRSRSPRSWREMSSVRGPTSPFTR